MDLLLNTFSIKELTALRLKGTSDQLPVINSLLPKLAKEVFTTSLNNGFWEINEDLRAVAPLYVRDIDEAKLLIISEIIEYVEATRKTEDKSVVSSELFAFVENKFKPKNDLFKFFIEKHIKGTKEEEIADSVIRIMDLFTGVFPDREFTIPNLQQEIEANKQLSTSSLLLYIIGNLTINTKGFDLEVTLISMTSLLIFGLDCNPIDILLIMFIKNEYNKTRGYKHGKTF